MTNDQTPDHGEPWENERSKYPELDSGAFELKEGPDGKPKAVSKKEFINKIGPCKKEAKETKFFLRMAATAEPGLKEQARTLWREAKELHLIFCRIFRSGKEGRNDQ